MFAALSDPVRLRLLSIVASEGEVCSCHLEKPLACPREITQVMSLWTVCVSGALLDADYAEELARAGFGEISIERRTSMTELT